MYIGSLTDSSSGVSVSYYYTRRGLDTRIFPSRPAEKTQLESYGTEGNLICDFAGFDGTAIGDSGVDVHFIFDRKCYVDNLTFDQMAESQIKHITVLSVDGDNVKAVGQYSPETGKNLCGATGEVIMCADGKIATENPDSYKPFCVNVGYTSDHIILRLDADYVHIVIGHLKLFGGVDLAEAVYPLPKDINYGNGFFKGELTVTACDELARAGADYFADVCDGASCAEDGNIRFKLKEMADEAFEIKVDESGVAVYSNSKRGFVYAAAKLVQLCSDEGIRFAEITDAPYMEIRGAHVALVDKTDLEFFKRLVKYVYVPLGYNTVILQVSALMEYKNYPEIAKAWVRAGTNYEKGEWPCPAHYGFLGATPYTQDEVREICDYIRSFGLEIAAEVQTFGHVQYVTMAFPETAEPEYVDEKIGDSYEADERPTSFYHHCMCPNHEDYYKIFFNIIDEVCDVIKPEKYIHIGHDEIYTYGKCEKCRSIPLAKLLADEITAMHDYIASKGLKTMMWSDMIVNEVYSIPEAIDLVPKDIICLPFTWYFHLNEDTEPILADHGFEYVIGNFYSSHYPRFNKRKQTPGWRGAEVSAWVRCNEDIYCYEGKVFEFIYSANMMWNETYYESMRNTYTQLVSAYASKVMKQLRGDFTDVRCASKLDIDKCSKAVPFDITNDVDGCIRVATGENKEVKLDMTAEKLYFVQATDKNGGRIPWQKLKAMAKYVIKYADGTTAEAPVYYGRDICEYRRTYAAPIPSPLFRHEGYTATCYSEPIMGKTENGEDYTLYVYPWSNPNPDKTIESVQICHEGYTDASLMLFDIYRQ